MRGAETVGEIHCDRIKVRSAVRAKLLQPVDGKRFKRIQYCLVAKHVDQSNAVFRLARQREFAQDANASRLPRRSHVMRHTDILVGGHRIREHVPFLPQSRLDKIRVSDRIGAVSQYARASTGVNAAAAEFSIGVAMCAIEPRGGTAAAGRTRSSSRGSGSDAGLMATRVNGDQSGKKPSLAGHNSCCRIVRCGRSRWQTDCGSKKNGEAKASPLLGRVELRGLVLLLVLPATRAIGRQC
jgi:hypothetical protein